MKVGDKYVIEIEEVIRRNGEPQIARIKGFNTLVFDKYGLEKLEPYDGEKVYRKGYVDGMDAVINESAEISTKDINSAYTRGLNDLKSALTDKAYLKANFGTSNWLDIIRDFEPDKIVTEWQDYRVARLEKSDITVGDEVVIDDKGRKAVVSRVLDNGLYNIVFYNGDTNCVDRCFIAKTDRHFPQIAEVLAELRGEE